MPRKLTCQDLRLDLESAEAGRTWLLLPEGHRAYEAAKVYPLPNNLNELRRLAIIPPPTTRSDSGCVYLRRALEKYQAISKSKRIGPIDVEAKIARVEEASRNHERILADLAKDATEAVDKVKTEIEKATASLKELFDLGKRGLEGQMLAHLKGEHWQGELIDGDAFRECFRLVSQAVKGLGMPSSDDARKSREAIIEEYARALGDTREALDMSPGAPEKPQ